MKKKSTQVNIDNRPKGVSRREFTAARIKEGRDPNAKSFAAPTRKVSKPAKVSTPTKKAEVATVAVTPAAKPTMKQEETFTSDFVDKNVASGGLTKDKPAQPRDNSFETPQQKGANARQAVNKVASDTGKAIAGGVKTWAKAKWDSDVRKVKAVRDTGRFAKGFITGK